MKGVRMEKNLIEFGESRSAAETLCQVFAFHGIDVRMRRIGNIVQVCVSDFAKAFPKKNLGKIANSQEISDYVSKLSEITNVISADLLQVTKGGNPHEQGTWAHQKVAIRIAQKLSVEFSIWVDGKIEELLEKGSTSIMQHRLPQTYSEALRELADQVEQNQQLQLENKEQAGVIEQQKPKVVFADALLGSPDGILIGELAKILYQNGYKTGEIRLFEQLRREGYLCVLGSDYNMPKQEYVNRGYFEITKGTRSDNNGVLHQTRTTKVLPKGVKYFINKYVRHEPTLFDYL